MAAGPVRRPTHGLDARAACRQMTIAEQLAIRRHHELSRTSIVDGIEFRESARITIRRIAIAIQSGNSNPCLFGSAISKRQLSRDPLPNIPKKAKTPLRPNDAPSTIDFRDFRLV
jgi:hypothetical protein